MTTLRVHHFATCELDETRRQLRRDGVDVALGPRVFALLAYLVSQAHRVVPHAELRAAIWPRQRISDAAVHAGVSRARAAIGDGDDTAPMIRTFARYGYRFVAELRSELPRLPRGVVAAAAPAVSASALPDGCYGRAVELERLSAALDAALDGRGTLAVIRGVLGSGKTHLAAAVARRAAARGFMVLGGHCLQSDESLPFWLWAQMLRRYAAQREPDAIRAALGSAAADVARIAPALRDRCPELAAPSPLDAAQAELRVHESLLGFVTRAAAAAPLLLVADDVQWADAASLRVLAALASEVRHSPAVVLALVEAHGDERRLAALRPPALGREDNLHLELSGLAAPQVRQLMADALARAVPAAPARLLAELAAGNPLVVLDTLRHLAAAGLLPPAQAAWPTREDLARAGVAEATGAMVARQLASLDAACGRVLAIAAIAGDEFAFAAVERVAAAAGDAALPAIESAARAGLIQAIDATGVRYRFAAPYVPAAIRQSLNPTRRAHLQAQLAAAAT